MKFTILVFVCFFFSVDLTKAQNQYSRDIELLNYLVCTVEENALVDSRLISWKSLGYNSFSKINPINFNFGRNQGNEKRLDFRSLLHQDQILKINEMLESELPLEIDSEILFCNAKLNYAKGIVPKKTIYSYSYPMVINGKDQELYGLILGGETFELNYELKLKLYVKRKDSWELIYEELLGFS
jgi:hypothetical protein